jgi:hypothetical protein
MPVGAGYGLVGWAPSGGGGDEPIITPSFSAPVTMAFDGSHLWVGDLNTAIIQKVNVTNDMPGVVASVNLSSHGVSQVREIKYDSGSGLLFVSTLDDRRVIIVNKTTNAVVGFMNLASDGALPNGRARSVTFDGAGNVWSLERDHDTSFMRRYNIASVLANYPLEGDQTAGWAVPHFMEQLSFGGGFIWAGTGEHEFYNFSFSPFLGGDAYDQTISGGLLIRFNPSNGTFVAHVSGGPGQPPSLINGHSVHSLIYAFGSVWTGDDIAAMGKWDPSQFEPRNPATPTWHFAENALRSGSYAGEPCTDASHVWIGTGITERRVHRIHSSTNVVTAILITQGSVFESFTGSAFDGNNVWFTRRFAGASRKNGIFRMNMTPGSEHVDWQIVDGAEHISAPVPATGSSAGGTPVTIKGYGFASATGVTFDGVAATSFVVVNANTITCTTPAGTGLASIVVQRPSTNLTYNFAYKYV